MGIDDAEELLYTAPEAGRPSTEGMVEGSLPVEGHRRPSSLRATAGAADMEEVQTLFSTSAALTSPLVEDVVQICNVLECRQYSQNLSGTYAIRTGKEQGPKIRYIIVSQQLSLASRKVLRLLKTSLMKKKNLLSMDSCRPSTKLIKAAKHYYAEAPQADWVRIFASLVKSLMIPRALVFCDESCISQFHSEMLKMGISVSANLPEVSSGAVESSSVNQARRKAVQDFASNKSQFLLTRSEPAVCQIMLPKVTCVFHFGMPLELPSVYGVRLLPLD